MRERLLVTSREKPFAHDRRKSLVDRVRSYESGLTTSVSTPRRSRESRRIRPLRDKRSQCCIAINAPMLSTIAAGTQMIRPPIKIGRASCRERV